MASSHLSEKFKWIDENNHAITAGGILFYDKNGIWTVCETTKNGNITFNDPGGKYNFEDCDIYRTIVRELAEETYNTVDITRQQLLDIIDRQKLKPIYVNGHDGIPVYTCFVVSLDNVHINITLDPNNFQKSREKTLLHNPSIHEKYFISKLQYIPFNEIQEYPLGYRLKKVLSLSNIAKKYF